MLRFTGDASGDVCAHARSCFIQLVSKVTLQVSARRGEGGSPMSGDVCAHARSCFIQLVSKVTLQVSARKGEGGRGRAIVGGWEGGGGTHVRCR